MSKRRMCPHCRAFIDARDRVCPYCETEVGPTPAARLPTDLLGGLVPSTRFVTFLILVVNLGLFAATFIYSLRRGNPSPAMAIDGVTLYTFGAKLREAILFGGEWWRLVTAGFLHGGVLHILMNTWILFDLGAEVEEIYGSRRFVVIYFVATVTGFLASTLWYAGLSVGASAGLMGLIGAMIALGLRHPSSIAGSMRGLYVRWVIYILLFGLLPGLQVDNAAHIGGLAGGFAAAWLAGLPGLEASWRERVWRAAAYGVAGVTLFCFVQLGFRLAALI
ncbi:MAG: rhomboid family intramembrane serine protease [Bryobacteraceae bacterium]|nr:rhomboid family intramembrane serine protease [Bryobacteraceae bacterium]